MTNSTPHLKLAPAPGGAAPLHGSQTRVEVNALTNTQLGLYLDRLANYPRSWDRERRDAILIEAAKRLMWASNYDAHMEPVARDGGHE